MLNNILNIEGATVLSKTQQKTIVGGGDCQLFIRSNNGAGPGYWTSANYTVSDAQDKYNEGYTFTNQMKVTGYCCASCPVE